MTTKARALDRKLRSFDRDVDRENNAISPLIRLAFAAAELALENSRRLDDLDRAARSAMRRMPARP